MLEIFQKSERNTERVAADYTIEELLPPAEHDITAVRLFARFGVRPDGHARRVSDMDRSRLYRCYEGLARHAIDKKRFAAFADYFGRRSATYGR